MIRELSRRRESGGDDRPERRTQLRGALDAEARFESRLRLRPGLERFLEAFFTGFGQVEFLGAPVGCRPFDPNQTIPLQRQDVAPERRAIHHHVPGERVDRQRSQPFELRKDRELGRAQACRRQKLIIKLGDVPSRRADSEAIAFLRARYGIHGHRQILNARKACICPYMGAYTLVSTGEWSEILLDKVRL